MMKPLVLAFTVVMSVMALAEIKTQTIIYKDGDTELEGYMAWNTASKKPAPGIVIVHDWNGTDAYEQRRARELAELGYVGFCADIYGKGVRGASPQESGKLAGQYKGDRALFRRRLKAALNELSRHREQVDINNLGAMGYCFGGTGVLELARTGAPVKGIVSFHGGLDNPSPADDARIRAKVLILHGADDPFVPKKDVDDMKASFRERGVKYQMISYPGAVHAFTVPNSTATPAQGAAYNEAADKKSWQDMKKFFKSVFGR